MVLETGLQHGDLAEVPSRKPPADEAPVLPSQQRRRAWLPRSGLEHRNDCPAVEGEDGFGHAQVGFADQGPQPLHLRQRSSLTRARPAG